MIECGRWKDRLPVNERKCPYCHVLEDEFHFVLQCSLFSDLRKKYIANFYTVRPNMRKFIDLCNSESKHTVRNLGKRKEYLQ